MPPPLTSPPLVGSQHLYAERTVIAMQTAPGRPPLLVAATHTAIRFISSVCLSAVSPALWHRLRLSQTHSSLSHLLHFLSPLPGARSLAQVERGCFFLPHHPLLVSASGSDSPSAALKPKEEKSTCFSIGAEASSPDQQCPGLAIHIGQEPGR